MPYDVQEAMLHSLPVWKNCTIEKYAHAISHDAMIRCNASRLQYEKSLRPYTAGQINGTSDMRKLRGTGRMAGITQFA